MTDQLGCDAEDVLCDDCGLVVIGLRSHEHEWFMVHDEVWAEAGMPIDEKHEYSGEGVLCVGCLEQRLGRRLTSKDFPQLPVNDLDWQSERLRSRLTAP